MSAETLSHSINTILEQLKTRSHRGTILAEPIPSRTWARVGLDGDDVVLLLPRVTGAVPPDIRLERLTVSFNADCFVIEGARRREETLVILRLISEEKPTIDAFTDIVALILARMRMRDARSINHLVKTLVDLFRSLAEPTIKSVEGLYGELLVMHEAQDVDLAAAAWHATPGDRHDYAHGACRVEVKTTCGPRQHLFSYEQLRRVRGLRLIVASVIVEPDSDGESVFELLARVVARIDDQTVADRVIRQSVKSLGRLWGGAGTYRFDHESAAQNIRFYAGGDVPCISTPPLGLSEIRFKVDLQLVPASPRAKLGRDGELARALVRY